MADRSGNATALTVLCPIRDGHLGETAFADEVKSRLQEWNTRAQSPMALVPQTYLCRYFVLDDVYSEALAGAEGRGTLLDVLAFRFRAFYDLGLPQEDHLKSRYLVFSTNFHGDLDTYLRGMWQMIGNDVQRAWEFCWGFDQVKDADGFVAYMKRCRMDVSLFFVGSTDDALEEQLKALYVKQELTHFVLEHQGMDDVALQASFREFVARIRPRDIHGPAWKPGQYRVGPEWEAA